jgi:hypothetical protein
MSVPYSAHRPARTPVDAIRLFCLECCGSSLEFGAEYAAVRDCSMEGRCSLWRYRTGRNPKRKTAVAAEALKTAFPGGNNASRTRRGAETEQVPVAAAK